MRLTAVILALIVVVLSCMPCADAIALPLSDLHTEIGKDVSKHNHQEDLCSPFCYCACCSTQVITPHQFIEIFIHVDCFIKRNYNEFIPTNGIAVFLAIWNPPQL